MKINRPSTAFANKFKKTFNGLLLNDFSDIPILARTGIFFFSLVKFDEKLSEVDKDYDSVKCTYKNKPGYSMSKYIQEKFGKEANEMIICLNDKNFHRDFSSL